MCSNRRAEKVADSHGDGLDGFLLAGARAPSRRRLSAANRGGNPFLGPLLKLLACGKSATALAHRIVLAKGEPFQPYSSEFLEED